MAQDEDEKSQQQQQSSSKENHPPSPPASRPSTARRVSHQDEMEDHKNETLGSIPVANTHNDTSIAESTESQSQAQAGHHTPSEESATAAGDATSDALMPEANPPESTINTESQSQQQRQQTAAADGHGYHPAGGARFQTSSTTAAASLPLPVESSYIEAVSMDPSRALDDSLTEEAVREHLRDVESSFLPALSPIPTGSTNGGDGGVDDTYIFDSPDKAAGFARRPGAAAAPSNPAADLSTTTSSLENLDSSPTAAAAARTISRAVSMATSDWGTAGAAKKEGKDSSNENDTTDNDTDGHESSFISSNTDQEGGLSRSQSLSERMDAGNTPGQALRVGKRPKYLRSRHASQRSSASSFATESQDGSEATVNNMGADYALQSGGAVPALGMSSHRISSNALSRSISMGSVASGFGTDDYTDHSAHQLETLPEVDSPERRGGGHLDPMKTPKPSKENLNTTAPTDTVIARHVRNVQVPETLAREYKHKSGLETPFRQSTTTTISGMGTTGRTGRNMTLKEQSSTIERLSKENFDLKLKVMFLSDRLDKLSEEGIKEMISENVDLKTSLAVLQRDNKLLRRRVKELERQSKEEDNRPSTAKSGASSTDQTARLYDEEAQEREEELIYLRERVEEYAVEIERLRTESLGRESEKRKLAEIVKSLGERTSENAGRQDEVDVWRDLFETETARREQADEDNRKLREELFRMKQEMTGQGPMHHTTNIYNISKKRDGKPSPNRPGSGYSGEAETASTAEMSAATTLIDDLRRESEQLRHENAELRREVGAQTSMLTSRNREKERLYQEIEDLKMAQRRGGGPAPSTVDSILERSASRAGVHERSRSRGSGRTRQTAIEDDPEREELENQLADVRDKMSEVKLQNQELQRELEACMEDFETAVEGRRQAEETVLTMQEDLDNAMNDLVALQAERDEALHEQSEMENEFESLRNEAQEEIDALEAEADQRNEEMQRLQADLIERSENFDALQEEMRKMSEGLVRLEDEQSNKLRRIAQLEEELDSSNKELEELEQKLMEANDKNQRLSVQQESSQGEIAFLREEQEGDKIRIGDLEAAVANMEQSLREETDRAKELEERLEEERRQSEMVANKEKEEVQHKFNELNREASTYKDEVRRLRKNVSSREVEATEWKERLLELENNLGEALGDLNGTRSSLLQSIGKIQRELENTVRELDTSKAALVEKDRIIKKRDALLESHGLESRRLSELLEKERSGHRATKNQFETFQRTNQHLSKTASTQDNRITELESTRSQDRRKLAILEQTARDQLHERNELLLILWQRLSALCGREWANSNTLIDRQVLPSLEVIGSRLPGFAKNLLAAVKSIETLVGSFQSQVKAVERDLQREYQTLEGNLDVKTKKLDRLETMVRNAVASGSLGSQDSSSRLSRLEDAYRQLKVENATLRAAKDARARAAAAGYSSTGPQEILLPPPSDYDSAGSPSPTIHRGPGERDKGRIPGIGGTQRSSTSHNRSSRTTTMTRTTHTSGSATGSNSNSNSGGGNNNMDVAVQQDDGGSASGAGGGPGSYANDIPLLFRLRDMEYKLKMEREGRNQDRQAARMRLSGLESENKGLRDRARRQQHAADME